MLLRSIGAALLTVGAAHGFKNSSPFFMLSTQPATGIDSALVNTADSVSEGILKAVGDCEQSKYYIISQRGLTLEDLQNEEVGRHTRERAASTEYQSRVKIQSVLSEVDARELAGKIASKCGAVAQEEGFERIDTHASGQKYTGEGKEVVIVEHDALPYGNARTEYLKSFHKQISRDGPEVTEDHMIIVIGTPAGTVDHGDFPYEMDEPYPSAMHQDLKRDIKYEPLKSSNNSMQDGLPLFEKYQFLTPGLFMGLTVSLLMFVILWVGVSAIAGLEVSYMAFSKEMGPAAQNKGKQQ